MSEDNKILNRGLDALLGGGGPGQRTVKDINVSIPNDSKSVFIAWSIFHSFQYFIPIGLFILGFVVWFRRRKA